MMPRPKGKARKIAFNIMGKPPNMRNDRRKGMRKERDERLYKEERTSKKKALQ